MNKRTLGAFAVSFLVTFFILAGGTGLLWAPVSAEERIESLLLVVFVSALQAAALAYSVYRTREEHESFVFAGEVAAGAGGFARALMLLRLRALRPLWLSGLLILAGYLILSRQISLFGGLLICIGQIGWFTARARARNFVENSPAVPVALADYLLWLTRGMDAFAAIVTLAALAALRRNGETVSPALMIGMSFVLAALGVAYFYRAAREPLDLLFPIQALVVMLWVILLLTTIDYGFDFRAPRKVAMIAYRDCPDPDNRYFTVGNVKIEPSAVPEAERFEGCEYFYRRERRPAPEEVVEVAHRPGAIGIAWKQARFR